MGIIKLAEFKNIYAADSFADEYRSLFKKGNRQHEKYQKKLYKNLSILDENIDMNAFQTFQQFETLTNTQICSIRHVSKKNDRVLFFVTNGEAVILLACFLEKSNSDYESNIRRAEDIKKRLERIGGSK